MPTKQDLTPFIDPSLYNPGQFLPTSKTNTNLPTTGGPSSNKQSNWDPMGLVMGKDPITGFNPFDPLDMFGGLFGGNDNSWKPYVDENGNYVWNDPNKNNPVPVTNVPGASLKPDSVYRKTADQAKALQDLLPYLSGAVNQTILPNELAKYQASSAVSGPYAALMTDLYNTYGPQLNAIGNEIARRNALSQAETDKEVLQGPGTDLVKGAYDLSQIYDKPYYDSRAAAATRLQDLLSSINLSGDLSDTERSEIDKGLARQNIQAGTAFTPSQTNTVGNAMTYGQKSYERKTQAQDTLSKAIQASAAFLPAAKSGVDVFQVATGRASVPNSGNNLFGGTKETGSSAGASLGGQLMGGMNQLQMNTDTIESQKKDWLDQMNQITSSISDIGGMAGGFLG